MNEAVALHDESFTMIDAREVASQLNALSDPSRVMILATVAKAHTRGEEVSLKTIREGLALTQPTVSHHVRVLVEAGFLVPEKRVVSMFYRLAVGELQWVADSLMPAAPAKRGRKAA